VFSISAVMIGARSSKIPHYVGIFGARSVGREAGRELFCAPQIPNVVVPYPW